MRHCALALGMVCVAASAAAELSADALNVKFDDVGLVSVEAGGDVLHAAGDAWGQVEFVNLAKLDGSFENIDKPKPVKRTFDSAGKSLQLEYVWGKLTCAYAPGARGLDISLTVSNTGERTIGALKFTACTIRLPNTHKNIDRIQWFQNWTVFDRAGGSLGLVNWQNDRVQTALNGIDERGIRGKLAGLPRNARRLYFSNRSPRTAHHPIVDNRYFNDPGSVIEAGKSETWKLSLIAGPPDATIETLAPDAIKSVREKLPVVLNWPDRRPIGTIFYCHPAQGWKTNPRGFNFGRGPKHDVFTDEGRKVFTEQLMKYADACIDNLKALDAQGMILWDLEGEEFPHSISYVGDPRRLPEAAPEMNAVADAFFKKFTDAGLKIGVTIRPTEFYEQNPGKHDYSQRDVSDPVATMAEKIEYAKKRWGVSIFYLDSNVFGPGFGTNLPPNHNVPWVLPSAMLAELNKRFPDCLIIPEWSNWDDYRFTAPYSAFQQRQRGTDPGTRALWPAAFRMISVEQSQMETHFNDYLQAVVHGDVLLSPCWYRPSEFELVRIAYREAALLRAPAPQAVQTAAADVPALAALLRDKDEVTRYHAVVQLGKTGSADAASVLRVALDDENPAIRKAALAGLAHSKQADEATIARLTQWIQKPKDNTEKLLASFAAEPLGAWPAGASALAAMLDSKDRNLQGCAIRALGPASRSDENIPEKLVALLGTGYQPDNNLQEAIVDALGRMKAGAGVTTLLGLLANHSRDSEFLRQAAVVALGKIGDPSAIDLLIEHFNRGYSTVVVYSIHRTLDEALAAITGEHELIGRADWDEWRKQHAEFLKPK